MKTSTAILFHPRMPRLRVVSTLAEPQDRWLARMKEVWDAEIVRTIAPVAALTIILVKKDIRSPRRGSRRRRSARVVQNGSMAADIDELRRLRRARDRMDREYAQPLDVAALARTALMSPAHFSRRFRETYAETPYSYLMTRRIERAKSLLRRGDLSVTDVCFAVGWTSLGSFCARFSELVGEPPSTYRARDHEELRVIAPCQAMVITRPRRQRGGERAEVSSFGEASIEVCALSSVP